MTIGDTWETAADLSLLHENFADITHVAVVDPFIAPPVLRSSPPPLEVEVTETTVSFSRTYAAGADGSAWQAELAGLDPDAVARPARARRLRLPGTLGRLVGRRGRRRRGSDVPRVLTFRFSHAVTPIAAGADPARLAGQPQLRAREQASNGPAADLHRLLPTGAVDPGDHAAGARHRRSAARGERQRRRRRAPGAQDHPQHGGRRDRRAGAAAEPSAPEGADRGSSTSRGSARLRRLRGRAE